MFTVLPVRRRLTKIAQERALPFEPLIPNAVTITAMKQARAVNLTPFTSVTALMADLQASD